MHIWVGAPNIPSKRLPSAIKRRLEESRREKAIRLQCRKEAFSSPKKNHQELVVAETKEIKLGVPLTSLPEDVAQAFLRVDGWFQARDLLSLRVCRALRSFIGYRPLYLFKRALPILKSWRALTRRARTPQTPRTPTRPRNNSFQRSPSRNRLERPVLLF